MVASRIAFAALGCFVLVACGAEERPAVPLPAPAPPAGPSFQPAKVTALHAEGAEGTARRIESREAVPLTGPRVDAKAGDYLLEDAKSAVVVSAEGRVIDLGVRGGRDEITAIDPTVFLGLDPAHVEPVSIEVEGGNVLHVVRRVLEKPLLFHAFVSFAGGILRVETAVVAAAPLAGPVVVTLGERAGWSNVPTWVAGRGFVGSGGTFVTDFVARDSEGVAYAMCAPGGKLVARFDAPDSGFHEEASTGEAPELVPPDAASSHRVIAIAHAAGSLGRAAMQLPCGGPRAPAPLALPDGLPPYARVEVARCGAGPYARFFPGESGEKIPEGCLLERITAPGHAASGWFSPAQAAGRTLAPSGRLHFSVTDKPTGKALPARVLVRGDKGTPDPDWGDDPDRGAALNVVYSETGNGERELPPGAYRVIVGRGFEYTAVEKEVRVVAGKTTDVATELERVVDTSGWIAADLHLHAMPSPDAIQPLADRVRALVAAGVEVGVATDHNKVTDYKPVIRELGMSGWLASIVGDEVTTREPWWGHFNVFPLAAGSEPIRFQGTTPRAIFDVARASNGRLVQVNHPRMGRIGYLELLRFDRDDVAGSEKRVPLLDLGFDAMEVFNGDHYAMIGKVEEVTRDWYALLNAGHRITATGNSDSHKLTFHEPGVPRTLVAVANDDPATFDEAAFQRAVMLGKAVVSSGPFIRFTASGRGPGDSVPPGELEIAIDVDAPPWVDVTHVDLVKRGSVVASWDAPAKAEKKPEVRRFSIRRREKLEAGDWIIAIARGKKPMTYLHRPNATPFAFTNPIWIGDAPRGRLSSMPSAPR